MLRHAFQVAMLCVFCLALSAPITRAQSNFDVFTSGNVDASDGEEQVHQNWFQDAPNQLQAGYSKSAQTAGAQAFGGSSASMGQLTAFGFTHSSYGQVPLSFNPSAISQVIAISQWYDHLTVVSDSLPVNTPVTFVFTAELEGNIYVRNISDDQLGRVESHFDITDQSNAQNITFNYSNAGVGKQTQTVSFNTFVGDRLQVRGDMEVDAVADSPSPNDDNESDVDFGHTANLYIDSFTPGASYLADSGHLYVSDVPEPAGEAFVISFVAFGGILVCSRRKLRRQE